MSPCIHHPHTVHAVGCCFCSVTCVLSCCGLCCFVVDEGLFLLANAYFIAYARLHNCALVPCVGTLCACACLTAASLTTKLMPAQPCSKGLGLFAAQTLLFSCAACTWPVVHLMPLESRGWWVHSVPCWCYCGVAHCCLGTQSRAECYIAAT